MTDTTFAELDQLQQSQGPAAAIERLIETLRSQKDYRRLFDALMLRKKLELGLPLVDPASLDVPEDKRREVEDAFIATAREVGHLFLAAGDIPQAWVYFRTIQEPEPVREAIEAADAQPEADERTEELIQVALGEGANPAKGLALLLHTHGTCNTITAFDQHMHILSPQDRRRAAAMLVGQLYDDLRHTLRHEVEQKLAGVSPPNTVRELIAGRDWLFAEGNYHVDVSHLNSVVRFARFLEADDPELRQVIELAEYGSRLSAQFQYPGDPPFDEFYPAHIQFFKALADEDRDAALGYFRKKLADEPDAEDKPMLAYVLTDLLLRCGRQDDAIEVAAEHLSDIEDPQTFSFTRLCRQGARFDLLQTTARRKGDLVGYTAAVLQQRMNGHQ